MATLYVGCAMWAHPHWVGRFLSPGNKGRELVEYSRWCNAVEGNTTFYAVPAARTLERWVDQAPPWFRFAFKLPRTLTHERRLRSVEEELAAFLDRIAPLGDRIGPLQIQLPPSFGPESLGTLHRFVQTLPADHRWMVELRHAAFFAGGTPHRDVDAILGARGIGRVVLDTRPLYATPPRSEASLDERRTKPALPIVDDGVGTTPIVRVIGSDDREATIAGLDAWIPTVVRWIDEGRTPFVFVHQPENLESPALARRFHSAVAAATVGLDPLPIPLPVSPAGEVTGQSSLF